MATYQLSKPKQVIQTGLTCWAAALESWLSVKSHSPVAWRSGGEKDIVADLRTWNELAVGTKQAAMLDAAGSLTKAGAIWVLENAGMQGKGFPNPRLLSGSYLYQKLKEKGHLYVIRTWPQWSHAEVIYGISDWDKPLKCLVSVMDPRPTYGYFDFDLNSFQTDRSVLVAWLP